MTQEGLKKNNQNITIYLLKIFVFENASDQPGTDGKWSKVYQSFRWAL